MLPNRIAWRQLFADELDCLVIAPDTFRGVTTSFIPYAIWLALTTPQARVNRDLDDVLAWAASAECGRVAGVLADTKRVAVCGFCYGGGKAIRYTTQARPDAATVVWYGSPLTNPDDFASLRAPVCAVFGVDDQQIPQRLVSAFREALESADVEHEVMSYYGAGHAFWSDVGQVEREEMPVIAGYRLTTTFLKGFYAGKESFSCGRPPTIRTPCTPPVPSSPPAPNTHAYTLERGAGYPADASPSRPCSPAHRACCPSRDACVRFAPQAEERTRTLTHTHASASAPALTRSACVCVSPTGESVLSSSSC